MKKFFSVLSLIVICVSCRDKEIKIDEKNEVVEKKYDTLLYGGRNKNYEIFTHENCSLPVLEVFNVGKNDHVRNNLLADSINTIKVTMVGFKERSKFYPIRLSSIDIDIIDYDSSTGINKFILLEDSVQIKCYLDCQDHNIRLWKNSGDSAMTEKIVVNCTYPINIGTLYFFRKPSTL